MKNTSGRFLTTCVVLLLAISILQADTKITITVEKGKPNVAQGNWDTVDDIADKRKTIAIAGDGVKFIPSETQATLDLGTKVFFSDKVKLKVTATEKKDEKPTPEVTPERNNILELTENSTSKSVATYIIDPVFSVHDAHHWGKWKKKKKSGGKAGKEIVYDWDIKVQAGIDLDIDSDNTVLYTDPERISKEDTIEEDKPGKYFAVNDYDVDKEGNDDLIFDYADGFNRNGKDGDNDDIIEEAHQETSPFVPVMLDVHKPLTAKNNDKNDEPTSYDEISYTFTYTASEPDEAIITAVTDEDGTFSHYNCQAPRGYRLWKARSQTDEQGTETYSMPTSRDKRSVVEGGDFVPDGLAIKAKDLGMEDGKHKFYLEAIPKLLGDGGDWSLPAAELIKVKAQFEDHQEVTWIEKVYVTPVQVDIDIDSDNNDGFKRPKRSYKEDAIENTLKYKKIHPGKVIGINDDDSDLIGDDQLLAIHRGKRIYIKGSIPDWADGFDRYADTSSDNWSPKDEFVPVCFSVKSCKGRIDLSKAQVRISYSQCDPKAKLRKGTGTRKDPYIYVSPTTLPGGRLRLWTKDASSKRTYKSIKEKQKYDRRGYFVPSGDYSWKMLDPAGTGEFTLYLEAIKPSKDLGDLQIVVKLDPDGKEVKEGEEVISGPAGWVATDALRVTALRVDLDISRLEGQRVIDPIEHREGSVTKYLQPDEDTIAKRKKWWLRMPKLYFSLPDHLDLFEIYLEKDGPGISMGKFKIYKDNVLFMDVGVSKKKMKKSDFTGKFYVESIEGGVQDYALVAYYKNEKIVADKVRVSGIVCKPKSGPIRFVNSGAATHNKIEFDDILAQASRTIDIGVDYCPPNGNILVTREPVYKETSIGLRSSILIAGLGGKWIDNPAILWRTKVGHVPQYTLFPRVDGQKKGRVFIANGVTDTILAGLNINNGRVRGIGGGMKISASKSIELIALEFKENRGYTAAGLSLEKSSSNILVSDCSFKKNIARGSDEGTGYGGGVGIFNSNESVESIMFERSLMQENISVVGGGGLFSLESKYTTSKCYFYSNDGGNYGGGIGARGLTFSKGKILVTDCLVQKNEASFAGGGIANVPKNDDWKSLVAAAPITGVYAPWGGAPGTIKDTIIFENNCPAHFIPDGKGEPRGGGIYNAGNKSKVNLISCSIFDNVAEGDGSGVCLMNFGTINGSFTQIFSNRMAGDDGGAVSHGGSSTGIWNYCTFTKNSAYSNGGALHASTISDMYLLGCKIEGNSAIYGTGGGIYLRNSTLRMYKFNQVASNSSDKGSGGGLALWVTNTKPAKIAAGLGIPFASYRIFASNRINGNSAAKHGGGIFAKDTTRLFGMISLSVDGSRIDQNSAKKKVDNIQSSGIFLQNISKTAGAKITNNKIFSHLGAGIVIIETSVQVEDNQLSKNVCGMITKGSSGKIHDNLFSRNTKHHLKLISVASHPVTNNWFIAKKGSVISGVVIDKSKYSPNKLKFRKNQFLGHKSPSYAMLVKKLSTGIFGGIYFIDARQNFWGHRGGPNDPKTIPGDGDYNNNPAGDAVGDGIKYKPFLAK